jgi:hypothetical protein
LDGLAMDVMVGDGCYGFFSSSLVVLGFDLC